MDTFGSTGVRTVEDPARESGGHTQREKERVRACISGSITSEWNVETGQERHENIRERGDSAGVERLHARCRPLQGEQDGTTRADATDAAQTDSGSCDGGKLIVDV
eukprot:2035550-Pleurochrysis_carterae.AAC.3